MTTLAELDQLIEAPGDRGLGGVFGSLFGIKSPGTWADASRAAANGWRLAHRDHYHTLKTYGEQAGRMRGNVYERLQDRAVSDNEILTLRAEFLVVQAKATDLAQALDAHLAVFMRSWRQENPEPKVAATKTENAA